MLLGFVDKLGSIFDRRFIHAYWLPSFIFVVLLTALGVVIYGVTPALQWWNKRSASESILCSIGFLLLITMLAILIQPFATSLTRFYLGYWPASLSYFINWGTARERRTWKPFQVSADRLLPTRLGNVLASAYDYPDQVYNLDSAIWLPRLTPLLPESFRSQMDNALTPLFCLLNLSTFFSALAIVGGLAIVLFDQRWWLFLSVWMPSLLLARACYRASVRQCAEYGALIRVAFDLYRSELFKQLRVPLPQTPELESPLWPMLERWIHFPTQLPVLPWEELQEGETPLHYDNYKEAPAVAANAINVSVTTPIQLKLEHDT